MMIRRLLLTTLAVSSLAALAATPLGAQLASTSRTFGGGRMTVEGFYT